MTQLAAATAPESAVWEAFWRVIFDSVMPRFFEDMFATRGAGRSFYGRAWKPLSERWLAKKSSEGWDPRIGRRVEDLVRALTSGDFATFHGDYAEWGATVNDFQTGRPYAAKFNATRPILDDETARELRAYIRAEALPQFDAAVAALRKALRERIR